jgi:hypothetical protein
MTQRSAPRLAPMNSSSTNHVNFFHVSSCNHRARAMDDGKVAACSLEAAAAALRATLGGGGDTNP